MQHRKLEDFLRSCFTGELELLDRLVPKYLQKADIARWRKVYHQGQRYPAALANEEKLVRHRFKHRLVGLLQTADMDYNRAEMLRFLQLNWNRKTARQVRKYIRQQLESPGHIADLKLFGALLDRFRNYLADFAPPEETRTAAELHLQLAGYFRAQPQIDQTLMEYRVRPGADLVARLQEKLTELPMAAGTRYECYKLLMVWFFRRGEHQKCAEYARALYREIVQGRMYSRHNLALAVYNNYITALEQLLPIDFFVRELSYDDTPKALQRKMNRLVHFVLLRKEEVIRQLLREVEAALKTDETAGLLLMFRLIRTEHALIHSDWRTARELNDLVFLEKTTEQGRTHLDKLYNHKLRILLLQENYEALAKLLEGKVFRRHVAEIQRYRKAFITPQIAEAIVAWHQRAPEREAHLQDLLEMVAERFQPLTFSAWRALRECTELLRAHIAHPPVPAERLLAQLEERVALGQQRIRDNDSESAAGSAATG